MSAISGEVDGKTLLGTTLCPGGEMLRLIREKDWSRSPIGPVERWSPTLKIMVDFLLANRFPLLLWWGPQYVSIYNDAYRPILGAKHPRAVGQPFRGNLEQYSLSAISALAERAVAALVPR